MDDVQLGLGPTCLVTDSAGSSSRSQCLACACNDQAEVGLVDVQDLYPSGATSIHLDELGAATNDRAQ